MNSRIRIKVFYWLFTMPVVFIMLMSAIGYFLKTEEMVQGITHLGYPLYVMKILGTAKVLGVIAILHGRPRLLKEWAYAGFAITFVLASASHLYSHDGLSKAALPLIFLGFLLVSHRFWYRDLSRAAQE